MTDKAKVIGSQAEGRKYAEIRKNYVVTKSFCNEREQDIGMGKMTMGLLKQGG